VKTYGLTLCLRDDPEKIETYRRYHQNVWPEVLADLRAVGIREMQIFLLGRRMFMYLETDDDFDLRRDFPRAQASPRSKEWNQFMATLQERAPEASPEDWWAPMELVFSMQWPQHLPGRVAGG
jgi:L-rhamnose mutarotase